MRRLYDYGYDKRGRPLLAGRASEPEPHYRRATMTIWVEFGSCHSFAPLQRLKTTRLSQSTLDPRPMTMLSSTSCATRWTAALALHDFVTVLS